MSGWTGLCDFWLWVVGVVGDGYGPWTAGRGLEMICGFIGGVVIQVRGGGTRFIIRVEGGGGRRGEGSEGGWGKVEVVVLSLRDLLDSLFRQLLSWI